MQGRSYAGIWVSLGIGAGGYAGIRVSLGIGTYKELCWYLWVSLGISTTCREGVRLGSDLGYLYVLCMYVRTGTYIPTFQAHHRSRPVGGGGEQTWLGVM